MFEKKKQAEHKPRDDGVELENQFIMRFPKVGFGFCLQFEKSVSINFPSFVAPCNCGAWIYTGGQYKR